MKIDLDTQLEPDPSQEAFMRVEGSALAISGPGGGKTTALGFRGRYMIESLNVDPDLIRGLNFSVSADEELSKVLPMVDMSTMHALAYRTLCNYSGRGKVRILDSALILKQLYPYWDEWTLRNKGGTIELKKVLVAGAPEFDGNYESYKKKEGILDFADLLLQFYDLLKRGVAQEIIGRRHLLVDELQDICHLMYATIVLMEPITISAIGDPFQSMYSWRGSYSDIFDDFRRDFKPTEIPLMYIHRSSQGIVDAYEKLYQRGLKSIVGNGGDVSVFRGRGSLGEVNLIEQALKPGDTVLARTNKQLQLVFDRIGMSCVYIKSHRRLFDGVSPKGRGNAPYVNLMTLNEAKGRTLQNVFIIGVDEGLLPHGLATNIEEEKHLFYVGMSRPSGNLFMSFQNEPSRFLRDLRTYAAEAA